ncbi:MAG: chemotaxis protein CheX [Spirochaetaceae bacterium]|jgi:CheY-specific phosphatase CheX|nr:chemotaxis protein CheX [Spirochaetaceae bacterium]
MSYGKILIVDDSTTSRMIMKRCFFIAGYENSEYLEAEDGLAALSLWEVMKMTIMNSDEEKIRKSFINAVIETFAEMAFIDVIPVKNYSDKISHTSILGLTFNKPGEGSLLFFMTKECKKQLVENIYGEDWTSLNDMEIDDCLLEILNVLAGDFLKNLYDKNSKVSMSFPRLYFDDDETTQGENFLKFIFNAEGAMFMAKVSIDLHKSDSMI